MRFHFILEHVFHSKVSFYQARKDIDSVLKEPNISSLSSVDKGNIEGHTEHAYNVVFGTCRRRRAGTSFKLCRTWSIYWLTERMGKDNKMERTSYLLDLGLGVAFGWAWELELKAYICYFRLSKNNFWDERQSLRNKVAHYPLLGNFMAMQCENWFWRSWFWWNLRIIPIIHRSWILRTSLSMDCQVSICFSFIAHPIQ